MSIDVLRLKDHVQYGLPYHGDVSSDIIDVLDCYEDAINERDFIKDRLAEVRSTLFDVEESVLYDATYAIKRALSSKTKKDMKEWVVEANKSLEALHNELETSYDYTIELLSLKGVR